MDTNDPKGEGVPLDGRRRRILFRATHRGTHETDLLIGGYVAPRLATMSESELDALEEVMELPDVALADWLCGRVPIPPEVASPVLLAMRAAAEDGSARAAALPPRAPGAAAGAAPDRDGSVGPDGGAAPPDGTPRR